ncbi:hypothetical protein QC760_005784 [Botrytis cinerea]
MSNSKRLRDPTMETAGSITSSTTSTSHTMTASPTSKASVAKITQIGTNGSSSIEDLITALTSTNRHTFIAPSSKILTTSSEFSKETLDRFAGKIGDEQATRLKEQRKKRKRGDRDEAEEEVLKIRKIHTQGFEAQQVFEQAKRVVDALKGEVARGLEELGIGGDESEESKDAGEEGSDMMEFDEDGFAIGSDIEGEEGDEDLEDMEEEFHTDSEDENDAQDDGEAFEVFVEDPNKLNDGFFSIDEFNKQTEFLERQDASADPYTGEASDEEDIDWGTDPMSMPIKADKGSKRDSDDDDDMDLDEAADVADDNTNDILYKDFFEPPPRKIGKGERQANYLERQAKKAAKKAPEEDEAAMERAMADVRRDLFDDEDDANSEDALSDLDPADPKSRRSAHERRQAKISEEIRRLEAASVAKRDWTLAGEAKALDRPMNSLLEEDLDFERTGKPVPVITAEVSESIEELIKRRILAQEFDEVIRRRPDSLTPANTRRGLFELDDSKNQQSLAEIYEEEHVKNTNPDTYVSATDEKLQAQEKEVENLWKDICAKLDALSSWHYKPKPAAPSLTVVGDVATISMEDAQPSTASGIAGAESRLAPQEIYKAGQVVEGMKKDNKEITRGGAPLKRGGVKVIGKRGEMRDVEGKKIMASEVVTGGGGFKL